jgi:O-antigen/teichoic acid export membrane protein
VRAVSRLDVAWGYLAQALNIGAGIVLLPVIVHFLSPADVGMWFVFVTLAGLAQLLEFGFQPTIARYVAYVYAGARELSREPINGAAPSQGVPDTELLKSVFRASRRIYAIVAMFAGLVLLLGGSAYVVSVVEVSQSFDAVLFGWVSFALGYVLTFYFGYFNSFLLGRGDVALANKALCLTRAVFLVLGSASVALGFGLQGLGLASLLAAGLGRWVAHYFFVKSSSLNIASTGRFRGADSENVRALWHNASRLGLVQLGSFLILRGNILIASSKLGVEIAASYSMTVTVLLAISSVAMVVCQASVPYMSALQAKCELRQLREVYGQVVILAWALYLCCFVILVGVGASLFPVISKGPSLLPLSLLLTMGVVQFLELNHSMAATYITTINKVPFLSASLWSGTAILLLSFFSVGAFGIWGLVFSQALVQLVYNNWKWPLEAVRHLRTSYSALLSFGYSRLAGRYAR